MEKSHEQNLANHRRFDPVFHAFALPILVFVLPLYSIIHLVRHPDLHAGLLLIVAIALAVLTLKTRMYALVVQDRVIELEERLRLARLLSPAELGPSARLTQSQLIGLRFASDAELPGLAAAALAENLSREEIKKRVKNWRPDLRRA